MKKLSKAAAESRYRHHNKLKGLNISHFTGRKIVVQEDWPQFLLSGLFLACLGYIVAVWWHQNPRITPAGKINAGISVLMFSMLCVRFIWVWMDDWHGIKESKRQDSDLQSEKIRGCTLVKIFAVFLITDIIIILFVFVLQVIAGNRENLLDALNFWRCTDSQHYLNIAEDWYLSEGEWDRLVQL